MISEAITNQKSPLLLANQTKSRSRKNRINRINEPEVEAIIVGVKQYCRSHLYCWRTYRKNRIKVNQLKKI